MNSGIHLGLWLWIITISITFSVLKDLFVSGVEPDSLEDSKATPVK